MARRRPIRSVLPALLLLAAHMAVDPPRAGAQTPPDAPPPSQFQIYWLVGAVAGTGWDNFDFRGIPISKNITITSVMGLYPAGGPHVADGDPTWLPRHLAKLDQDISIYVPDPAYNGL